MTVTKAVVRGIVLASLATASARGGSILTLGVNSVDWPEPAVAASPTFLPASPGPVAPASSLSLGVYSSTIPSQSTQIFPPASTFAPSPPMIPVATSPPVEIPAAPASGRYDAFINLGSGPYPGSGSLATGVAQPWYLGAAVDRLFGGLPTIQQAANFDGTVLQRVQQTFALSGVPVSLTLDPNAQAAHTVSVVSQTTNPALASALGMTYLGGNGFQYIDTAANSASSVDQLAWIVAHNVAHELMLAFGVPEVHDQSGGFIDTPNASWSMMTSPGATFSTGAVADLLTKDFQASGTGTGLGASAQLLGPPTVPEPSTAILWATLGAAGLVAGRTRRRAGRASLSGRERTPVRFNLP